MCGIVGLRLKNELLHPRLGRLVAPMLECLASRGPDSTGVAIYARSPSDERWKYSLGVAVAGDVDWAACASDLARHLGSDVEVRCHGQGAVFLTAAEPGRMLGAMDLIDGRIRLVGHGPTIEVFKAVGPAGEVCRRYGVVEMSGHQAIGHTRMATESAVTTEHSHPFAVAPDLSLVHNGSFSNYASIRRDLAADGIRFDTDNDSEVAARFLAARLHDGDDLAGALRGVLEVFDGFFTLLVGSGDRIALVRDSFACKPAVVAETDDYVAIASEYVALAGLPGIEQAEVFEPLPETVWSWPS